MAFGLMLLLIGLMVEGRRTTWIYIGLIVLAGIAPLNVEIGGQALPTLSR
jgi:hypothetical protein